MMRDWVKIRFSGPTCRNWCEVARCVLLTACVPMLVASCATPKTPTDVQRVLFVGNSVIYTNNLPAVFGTIVDAQSDAPQYEVDMFARGGATLTEMARDSQLLGLITSGGYSIVVLQEKGGNDLCVLTRDDRDTTRCQVLISSHVRLAKLAREQGARVLYLGTYQFSPGVSQALVSAESDLSVQMAAQYVEISEHLRSLRDSQPQLPWLYVDKGHPGIATTALMGIRLYEALSGKSPLPFALCTGVELYTPKWSHDGIARHAKLVAETEPPHCLLSQAEMATIMRGGQDLDQASSAMHAER